MEMNQIRYFLAVCEHRNFTHAASASNVSQPSLTTAIKKLEGELELSCLSETVRAAG